LLPHEPVVLRPATLRFGRCELRPLERRLLIDGRRAALGGRAFDLLLALAERPGRLVTKHELLDLAWPDVVVEEGNLTVQMSSLRKLLGPDAITTVPGRGYRFCVAVELDGADPPHATAPAPTLSIARPSAAPGRPLIGRDADLAALGALLEAHRLVTIAGAGGIGKTLLAQHLLAAYALPAGHGACWIELAPLESPLQVVGAIAAALGVRAGAGGDALAGLVAACAPLQWLLVLDNAEHLHAEVARVAQALHDGAPGVRLLVTSQAPLHLRCERLYRLDALALPPAGTSAAAALGFGAVALFVDRAGALDRRFRLHDGNAAAVIEICRRLDGIALALELAAARLPLLGVTRLAAALDERLRVLTVAPSGAPPRHQTLRAGLEWSHGLLSPLEQEVFRRLAVVSGSASLELAQQLLADDDADPWPALDALGALVDRSLVALVGDDDDAPRYRLLESPRALALERLQAAGEEALLQQRHARALARLLQRAFDDHRRRDGAIDAWQRERGPDLDNARTAFAWACRHDAAAAAAIAATLLLALPGLRERLALCEAIEPLLTDAVAGASRARVWLEGSVVLRLRRSHAAMAWARRAVQWYEQAADDRAGLYLALAEVVQCARRARSLGADEAATLLERLRGIERGGPALPPQVAARGVRCATLLMKQLDRPADEMLRNQQRAIALEAAAGQPDPMASVNYVNLLIELGRTDEALHFGLRLQGELQGTRHLWALDGLKSNLTAAWLAQDATREARALAHEGWARSAVVESRHSWADHLALLAALEGRARAAALLAGHADRLYAVRRHTRQGVEIQSYQRALALAEAALDDAAAERARADGAALTDGEVERIAFALSDET
jgi:predicted ATPase/DNA-binding winged helix-turn-helix (wHTH) protein